MQSVSTAFRTFISQYSRSFRAVLKVDGTALDLHVLKFTLHGGSNSDSNNFSIGSCMSQYVDLDIAGENTWLQNQTFDLYLTAEVSAGTTEEICMGRFTAEKPETDEGTSHVTAYDNMMRLERPFSNSDTTVNTTVASILSAITSKTGISFDTSAISSTNVSMVRPEGYTCREVLSYIAQLYGGFAVCKRDGSIRIGRYVDASTPIRPDRYWDSFKHNDYPYLLTKITCYTGEEDEDGTKVSYTAGSGNAGIFISNPFMTQDRLNTVWNAIGNIQYMPGSVTFLGDPRIDPWDIITVVDLKNTSYKVPCMSIDFEYDGGLTCTVEAKGASSTEEEDGFRGPNVRMMDRYYSDLLVVNRVLADKLDADEAEIRYASIENLDALAANITTLNARVGNFEEVTTGRLEAVEAEIGTIETNYLEAAKARISVLETDSATIKSLLAGNAVSGDLQTIVLNARNASIDTAFLKQIVSTAITVNDLAAGDIITDTFRVRSNDGSFLIEGSTLSITDGDGIVRLQLGKDANGEFNFAILDETGTGTLYDSHGVHEGALGDGLIVNRMVANDANISGSKLDIDSVVTEINGSSSYIDTSRIWFDEGNQTLNQAYSQMGTRVTSAESVANEASATARSATQAAQNALQVLSGISTLDALSAVLTNDAHVVHTLSDGSGGDYSECYTTIHLYLGDTDVTRHADVLEAVPSPGITGTYNATNRTYYVTDMSTDDGYVDFRAQYGLEPQLLVAEYIVVVGGYSLAVSSNGTWLTKRFSVSKSPDGKIGTSYKINSSALAILRDESGSAPTISPSSVTVFGAKVENGTSESFAGRWLIQETDDWSTYVTLYQSSVDEASVTFSPSVTSKGVMVTLSSASGEIYDTQSIIILTDAEGLPGAVNALDTRVTDVETITETTTTRVSNIETGIDGIRVELGETNTSLTATRAIADANAGNIRNLQSQDDIVWNSTRYDDGTSTTVYAHLYNHGTEITRNYPAEWYSWKAKTEDGETFLGYGYQATVNNAMAGFIGSVIWAFQTYADYVLIVGGHAVVVGGSRVVLAQKES